MTKRLEHMETLFKALADTTRLRIVGLLLGGEVCVCHIHESLRIPQPRASRHLAYLRKAGLVETRRDGTWIHYRLGAVADPVLAVIADTVRHALSHVDVVQRDAGRLKGGSGCGAPPVDGGPVLACCASAPVPVQVTRTAR